MTTIAASHTYHALYVALHSNHKQHPDVWTAQKCTNVLTTAMGGERFSWRVIGVTPAALQSFADHGYRYKSGMKVTRAHLRPRIATMRELLAPEAPLTEKSFGPSGCRTTRWCCAVRARTRRRCRTTSRSTMTMGYFTARYSLGSTSSQSRRF